MADLMDVKSLHRLGVAEFGKRVAQIGDDDWSSPTPCDEWDVRALVNHLVYEHRWAVPLLDGATIAEVGDRFEGDLLGDDPIAAWQDSLAEAQDSVAAVPVDRPVHLSMGDVPAGVYLGQLGADFALHAWDLARGIGADDRLDPALVTDIWARYADEVDELRASACSASSSTCPTTLDPQTRLARAGAGPAAAGSRDGPDALRRGR